VIRYCKFCRTEIHPLRLEILPHTTTCAKCSTEGPKAGRIVVHGHGEEIHTELEVIDNDLHIRLVELSEKYDGLLLDPTEDDDLDDEE
jgi:hypothetical protein